MSASTKFSFSLTGYLNLYHKGLFRGGQYKRYWFWFDEQSCSLQYYKSQDAYRHNINNPIGTIGLQFAKVSPPLAMEKEMGNNVFQIDSGSQVFHLAAEDANAAHTWIKQLQVKRSEWLKSMSAKMDNSLDQENKKRTMKPLHQRQGAVLLPTPEETDTESSGRTSPTTVRKIVNSHISQARHSANLDFLSAAPSPDTRRSTVTATLTLLPTSHPTLKKTVSDSGEFHPGMAQSPEPFEQVMRQSLQPPHHHPSLPTVPLSVDERERLQLEHDYHVSRGEVTKLQKELMRLQDKLAKRDEEIVQLNMEIATLKEEIAKTRIPHNDLRLENESLTNIIEQCKRSIRSLDDEIEVHKLHQKEHDKRIRTEKQRSAEVEREFNCLKAKYVRLLSDKFKITIPNPAGPQEDENDPEEEKFNNELLELMKQEGGDNPVFESYKSKFEDEYGDLHDWQSGTTVQHYLCRQLYLHYSQQDREYLVQEWEDYLGQMKKVRTKGYVELTVGSDRARKREFRNLLRQGIPIQHRTQVWTSLVYRHVGKLKDIKDATAGKGSTYYQSLLNSKNSSLSEKQIKLDLYRTLPSNKHFKLGGTGASKLENILIAFSHHNKNVGYCQGMNMLVAIGILFLDEETAFWFLVAIIERLLPSQYFTPGLLGAQADQAVVHELLAEKLPRLNRHLQTYAIDVSLVTFNWFLTLYVDALPTESVLRILDSFLYEGTKVLFRMCLGILKLNERVILSKSDPVTLFQYLKEIARHTFDVDSLFNAAFNELQPFPSRSTLSNRHQHHFAKMRDQWNAREKEREAYAQNAKSEKLERFKKQNQLTLLASSFAAREQQQARRHLVWECGCVRGRGEVWLACGERQQGKIGIITADGPVNIEIPDTDVASRVICIQHIPSCDVILLGTLDFILHAIDCKTRKEIWSLKMNDSILDIEATEDCTVFVSLADGFVAVLQSVCTSSPASEPVFIRIGSTPVACLTQTPNQQLWCGCGKSITIMSTITFEPVQSLVMGDNDGKIYKMESGKYGVWVSFRTSSVICLFDVEYFVKLLHVDYTTLLHSDARHMEYKADHRITSIMTEDNLVWVGSGSGGAHIFSIAANVSNPRMRIGQLAKKTSGSSVRHGYRRAVKTGGLLTGSLVQGTEEEDSSPVVERKGGERYKPRKDQDNYYDKRRKTAFGHTLRKDFRGERSKEKEAGKELDVYKLVHEASNQLVQTKNEAVRVILPLRSGENQHVVSCVHRIAEGDRAIQVWDCSSLEQPCSWTFRFLPSEVQTLYRGISPSPVANQVPVADLEAITEGLHEHSVSTSQSNSFSAV